MSTHHTAPAVLITGASAGIGLAATRALLSHGYRVYAGVHRTGLPDGLDDAVPIRLDVTDQDSARAAAEEIAARQAGAGLRAVVNNAGVIVQGPLELVPDEELERQFAVNVFGPARVTRTFLPMLRTGGGRVVNVSAPTARLPVPFAAPISASKAALEALSHALRVELAPWSIPVVTVVPGGTRTQIFAKADAAAHDALTRAAPDRVALYGPQQRAVAAASKSQRLSAPETAAAAIVHAVGTPRPRTRYLATTDARLFSLLSHLTPRLRDRLLTRALGLHRAPAPARS